MKPEGSRIYLSPPSISDEDVLSVQSALMSGWVAPVGPDLAAFEGELAEVVGVRHAVALSSGTAAIHLALKVVGVNAGDVVLVPTITFGATAFAVTYLGATPAFIDVDDSGNMCPELTLNAIGQLRASRSNVVAAIPVDLYGTPADYDALTSVFSEHGIAVVEDAAEGLGGRHGQLSLGSLGDAAALSFNGNKIITTSGGGVFLTDNEEFATKVRYWSTQAREPLPWYEHHDIGYNYRLSNILAALGRSQLRRLHETVAIRRRNREFYRERLESVDGVSIQEDPAWGTSNAWLTIARFSSTRWPNGAQHVREHLERHNIESRPIWKPMHQQPVFAPNPAFLSGVADNFFREGLCLPSGTQLSDIELDRVATLVTEALH